MLGTKFRKQASVSKTFSQCQCASQAIAVVYRSEPGPVKRLYQKMPLSFAGLGQENATSLADLHVTVVSLQQSFRIAEASSGHFAPA